jgi:hypothetical protein
VFRGRRPLGALAVSLLILSACKTDMPGPPAESVAGIYVMTTVSGRGPATGSVTLSATGEAERRVRYRQREGDLSQEYVARGTFHVRADGTVDLQLLESGHVWRPLTRLDGDLLSLRHPDPADGPDIVETYKRQNEE